MSAVAPSVTEVSAPQTVLPVAEPEEIPPPQPIPQPQPVLGPSNSYKQGRSQAQLAALARARAVRQENISKKKRMQDDLVRQVMEFEERLQNVESYLNDKIQYENEALEQAQAVDDRDERERRRRLLEPRRIEQTQVELRPQPLPVEPIPKSPPNPHIPGYTRPGPNPRQKIQKKVKHRMW